MNKPDYATVRAMRDSMMGYGAIAKELGYTKLQIRNFCVAHGLTGYRAHAQQAEGEAALRLIESAGLVYVSGDLKTKANVVVMDRTCNHRYQVCLTTIRQMLNGYYHHACPVCVEEGRKRKEQERQEEKEKRQWAREHKPSHAKQLKISICNRCGLPFVGNKKYCSGVCAKRESSARKEFKRRLRTQSGLIDKDISLRKLYQRDNGACYICGRVCNWDDFTRKDDAFIAGETYPSIEHVIPLAKGGEHSWDNVKLACIHCNTLKSDKLYLPFP